MAFDRKKYLAMQRELGGNEVILSRPPGTHPAPVEPQDAPLAVSASSDVSPMAVPRAPASPEPAPSKKGKHWSVDAPPIPSAPGLIIPPLPRGLMDQASPWNSLDDVARVIAGCVKCFLCQGRKR
ncbi:MAG TPA: hypothetical protein VFU23_12975, partial [Gemmatimonadales bacterium]|nr:hypothetical protein [Gemmatimonadales bacterium]